MKGLYYMMKKTKKLLLSIILAMLCIGITCFNNRSTLNVNASITSIPSKMRGSWKSKPEYSGGSKHIAKNIVVPAIKMKIGSQSARWSFVGPLPGKEYNHKAHTIRLIKNLSKHNNILLRGHGPYRDDNYFNLNGRKLYLFYHGGFIILTR